MNIVKGLTGLGILAVLTAGGFGLYKFGERAIPGLSKVAANIAVTSCKESVHDADDIPIRCAPGAEVVFPQGAAVVVCACRRRVIANIPPKRGFFERTFTRLHRWWNGPDKPEPTPPEPPKVEATPPPPAPPKAQEKLGVLAWLKGFYG